MMMRAFAPSAVTASDAIATIGLVSGLGSGSQSKNSCSYLKLTLGYLLLNSCPHTEFHPNRTKDIKLILKVKKICYRSALVGWSGQSKYSRFHFKLIVC